MRTRGTRGLKLEKDGPDVAALRCCYIEDPRNEGTETWIMSISAFTIRPSYIEDPRNEGTETVVLPFEITEEFMLH